MSKRKPKYPPNPMSCGCGAKGVQDLENAIDYGNALHVGYRDVHVVHCPLHAAAAEMLELLTEACWTGRDWKKHFKRCEALLARLQEAQS